MPNPGKNLAELQKSGTFHKHRGRYRHRVAAVEGFMPLGEAPAHLDDLERDAWNEILAKAPAGTLAQGDFMVVELAARLLSKSRSDWETWSPTDTRVLQSLANDLGMSPIKRAKCLPSYRRRRARSATSRPCSVPPMLLTNGSWRPSKMPSRYKPFDVLKVTNARERLTARTPIFYGPIGAPHKRLDLDARVAWVDLLEAAPPGRLERHHLFFLEQTAGLLSMVRMGGAPKGIEKLLGKCLRDMGLTPGAAPRPAATLAAFRGRRAVN